MARTTRKNPDAITPERIAAAQANDARARRDPRHLRVISGGSEDAPTPQVDELAIAKADHEAENVEAKRVADKIATARKATARRKAAATRKPAAKPAAKAATRKAAKPKATSTRKAAKPKASNTPKMASGPADAPADLKAAGVKVITGRTLAKQQTNEKIVRAVVLDGKSASEAGKAFGLGAQQVNLIVRLAKGELVRGDKGRAVKA